MILENYARFARYNAWMNARLMETCSNLSDAERKQPRGAPFGSIHGVWNHLLLCDHIWLHRLQNTPLAFAVSSLGQELFANWDELKAERQVIDARISTFVAELTEEKLAAILRITSISSPQTRELPVWVAVSHLFNHQTHHRGQITALMEQAGLDCGVTDFGAMPQF